VGNVLLGDDAAGCAVADLLMAAGKGGVIDCGTTPENHIATLRRDPPDVLLIVDAADMELEAGEFRLLSFEKMEAVADSSNGIQLSLLLEPFAGSMEIAALGIQPASLQPGAPLSVAVENAVRRVAELILRDAWREIEKLRKTD
jgi:hydrogenase 3 maturation protease